MGVGNLWLQWALPLWLLAVSTYAAAAAAQLCNVMQVRECYDGILTGVLKEFATGPLNASQLESLCEQYDIASSCREDLDPCLEAHPDLEAMESLYSAVYEDACQDANFKLLKSIVPMGKCAPLPLITQCLRKEMDKFEKSTEDARSSCNDLGAALTSCLMMPGSSCQKNGKRPKYAKKTVATLVKSKGCNLNGENPFVQGAELQPSSATGDDGECSYKQLKRCHEKQIKDIRKTMTRILDKGLLPDDDFTTAICRRKRETCYQHNKIEPCSERERNAIRKLEESMNEAQKLLCQDDRALVKNLVLTYKWWKVDSFVECSTDAQVNYITDYLYATARLHSDCGRLRDRLSRCLNESYASADQAIPKPDVDGARKVLAIFLDRMWCVDEGDLPQGPGGGPASGSNIEDDADEEENSTEDPAHAVTRTGGSAIPIVSANTDKGRRLPENLQSCSCRCRLSRVAADCALRVDETRAPEHTSR
ncbi:hypothetical protein HPB50_006655 [Hyalomma asiaticum]|uniref:Uncharacterized protein n=1 Tax=Hyalomma asiaticum TaxID=266040 RepID=A0ACB7SY55_HYAAI|nr:hypothetical protein HPB50_006655 [Hyalomma asiaticum]